MRHYASVMIVGMIAASVVFAQSPPSAVPPAFDVVSIKLNRSGSGGTAVRGDPGGGFTMTNGTAMTLLLNAYDLQSFEIVGAPDWVSRERYDVTARAGRDVPAPALPGLIKAMLADRFQLAAHVETREVPVLLLVRADPNGPLGPSLRLWTTDCNGAAANTCGMNASPGLLHMRGYRMDMLASSLSSSLRQRVLDQTGLTENYEIRLQWAPDGREPGDLPSLPTAVQEQLGLKLQSARRPSNVLVVDRIERPSEN